MSRESGGKASARSAPRGSRLLVLGASLLATVAVAEAGERASNLAAGKGHLTIAPTVLDFGDVAVDAVSPPQTVVLGNDGSADLEVRPDEPAYPFHLSGGSCPATAPFALAPDESCTLEYVFATDSGGSVEISVDVFADDAPAGTITMSGNGYYTADVAVTISADREFVEVGDTIVYTITVYMADGSDGAAVTVTDALPPELGNGTWTCVESNQSVCNSNTGSGSGNTLINYVQLADGNSVTYTYSATLLTADQDEIANTVSVAVDAPIVVDPVPDNNAATAITAIPLFDDGFDGP
ncbi:MAG TPA: choice-of-anchor D domain-containing protein [Rhodanobacteraceae bacterium]|jgi:uncharacterized repeat protein (TIGR01451 family)|nr:choice-of-anchor D domain-containing protein [Rhodanobacteraceae bacterium]